MFNKNGAYHQLQYITANKAANWDWGTQYDLSFYQTEAYPSAVIDIEDVLWVTWNHLDWEHEQNVLYWDNDMGSIDVTDDIVDSVTLSWELKKVNALDFNVANGHLYDPQNLLSTKNIVGGKGRKVHVRIGEHIGGYVYWVNQGTFIVDNVKMSYKRGGKPILKVACTGKTSLWRQQQISVSELYEGQMPDDVIRDIIDTHTQWLNTDYSLPTFGAEHSIFYQWLDQTVWEMVEEICDHFFYAMYEDVDGIFTCRPVSLTQAVDHEYSNQTLLLEFSPDDNYSDYTNRVRVIGETADYTDVVHNEEMITSRGGTVGWWVKKETETIYFSEDQDRQCRNPRLKVIHSPKEYGLLLDQLASGSGGLSITFVDPYEHYVEVTVKVADLTGALIGLIVAMIILGVSAIYCDWGKVCGAVIWGLTIVVGLIIYVLAAMAQYQYELWARPLGRVKMTVQYEANDIEFQRTLNGEIVTEEITDALCNSVTECRRVAEGELSMIRAQRKSVRFKKLCHLQDELLDKLKVYHPYSGEGMELLVVGLKRTYNKGAAVLDDISAWRYIP